MRLALTRDERRLWSNAAHSCRTAYLLLRRLNRARLFDDKRLPKFDQELDRYDVQRGYLRPGHACPVHGARPCSCAHAGASRRTELPERLSVAERQLDLFAQQTWNTPPPAVCSDCDRGPLLNDKCSNHLFDRPPSAARRRASRRAPRLPVGP